MKYIVYILLTCLFTTCTPIRKSYTFMKCDEAEMPVTRKYIGNFIDYIYTGPDISANINLIWIRTTIFNSYGKISAFGKVCEFNEGDKIYLRRMYSTPGPYGNWEYQIENDSSVVYRLSNYRYENNVLVQNVF